MAGKKGERLIMKICMYLILVLIFNITAFVSAADIWYDEDVNDEFRWDSRVEFVIKNSSGFENSQHVALPIEKDKFQSARIVDSGGRIEPCQLTDTNLDGKSDGVVFLPFLRANEEKKYYLYLSGVKEHPEGSFPVIEVSTDEIGMWDPYRAEQVGSTSLEDLRNMHRAIVVRSPDFEIWFNEQTGGIDRLVYKSEDVIGDNFLKEVGWQVGNNPLKVLEQGPVRVVIGNDRRLVEIYANGIVCSRGISEIAPIHILASCFFFPRMYQEGDPSGWRYDEITLSENEPDPYLSKGPVLTSEYTDKAPILNGRLNDTCWQGASEVGDFKLLGSKTSAREQTSARVAHDGKNLYLGIVASESRIKDIKKSRMAKDDEVWNDDCIEVMIDRKHDHKSYYHFIINAIGGVCDAIDSEGKWDKAWDSQCSAKAQIDGKSWTLELAIPFESLGGTPKEGEIWGFNIAREEKPINELSSWQPFPGSSFNDPSNLGHLSFRQKPSVGVEIVSFGGPEKNIIQVLLKNRTSKKNDVELRAAVKSLSGTVLANTKEVKLEPLGKENVSLEYVPAGRDNRLVVTVLHPESGVIYYQSPEKILTGESARSESKWVLFSSDSRSAGVIFSKKERLGVEILTNRGEWWGKLRKELFETDIGDGEFYGAPTLNKIINQSGEERRVFLEKRFGILGDWAVPWIDKIMGITDPDSLEKTMKDFFGDFNKLYRTVRKEQLGKEGERLCKPIMGGKIFSMKVEEGNFAYYLFDKNINGSNLGEYAESFKIIRRGRMEESDKAVFASFKCKGAVAGKKTTGALGVSVGTGSLKGITVASQGLGLQKEINQIEGSMLNTELDITPTTSGEQTLTIAVETDEGAVECSRVVNVAPRLNVNLSTINNQVTRLVPNEGVGWNGKKIVSALENPLPGFWWLEIKNSAPEDVLSEIAVTESLWLKDAYLLIGGHPSKSRFPEYAGEIIGGERHELPCNVNVPGGGSVKLKLVLRPKEDTLGECHAKLVVSEKGQPVHEEDVVIWVKANIVLTQQHGFPQQFRLFGLNTTNHGPQGGQYSIEGEIGGVEKDIDVIAQFREEGFYVFNTPILLAHGIWTFPNDEKSLSIMGKSMAESIDHLPNVVCYFVIDEPVPGFHSIKDLNTVYQALSPYLIHPIILNIQPREDRYSYYFKPGGVMVDVPMMDTYGSDPEVQAPVEHVKKFMKAVSKEKEMTSFCIWLSGHAYKNYDEIRRQGWYVYSQGVTHLMYYIFVTTTGDYNIVIRPKDKILLTDRSLALRDINEDLGYLTELRIREERIVKSGKVKENELGKIRKLREEAYLLASKNLFGNARTKVLHAIDMAKEIEARLE